MIGIHDIVLLMMPVSVQEKDNILAFHVNSQVPFMP
jgi:hypothetical protein